MLQHEARACTTLSGTPESGRRAALLWDRFPYGLPRGVAPVCSLSGGQRERASQPASMPLAAASLATCTAPARTSMRTVPPNTCLRAAGAVPGAPARARVRPARVHSGACPSLPVSARPALRRDANTRREEPPAACPHRALLLPTSCHMGMLAGLICCMGDAADRRMPLAMMQIWTQSECQLSQCGQQAQCDK